MKQTLKFTIESGEHTCASSPGVFCHYLRTLKYGTQYRCHLFDRNLEDINGWLQRLDKCKEASNAK